MVSNLAYLPDLTDIKPYFLVTVTGSFKTILTPINQLIGLVKVAMHTSDFTAA